MTGEAVAHAVGLADMARAGRNAILIAIGASTEGAVDVGGSCEAHLGEAIDLELTTGGDRPAGDAGEGALHADLADESGAEEIDGCGGAGGRGVEEGQAVEEGGNSVEGKSADDGLGVIGPASGEGDGRGLGEGIGQALTGWEREVGPGGINARAVVVLQGGGGDR